MNDAALLKLIRDVPDFPEPGIVFKDITPLLADAAALAHACQRMTEPYRDERVDLVIGVESRGFIFGTCIALALGCGFAPVRKKGKLPWETVGEAYTLEYGTAEVEMHRDAVRPGQRVLLVDDLIATGGTAGAALRLVERMGGEPVGASFLIELTFLDGRKALGAARAEAVLAF